MACDHLMKQNSSLELEVQSIEMAFHASSGLVSGILRQMSTPLHALTAFSSLLLETSLTPQQRAMVEAVVKSSTRLETQMKNQRGLSILEDGTLEFKTKVFNVSVAFKQGLYLIGISCLLHKKKRTEVINFIKPTAAVKKLSLSLVLAPDFPVYAVGDQEKLMQVVLNVVGNAVKFTEKGCVSVLASVAHPESYRDWRPFKLFLVSSEDHFYLKVQVDDFGHGISPQKIRKVFNRFKDPEIASNQSINSGLGLAISKRLLDLMGGRIWVESDGLGMGCTATFILKLGTFRGTSAT